MYVVEGAFREVTQAQRIMNGSQILSVEWFVVLELGFTLYRL